jgi:hypothetical protein
MILERTEAQVWFFLKDHDHGASYTANISTGCTGREFSFSSYRLYSYSPAISYFEWLRIVRAKDVLTEMHRHRESTQLVLELSAEQGRIGLRQELGKWKLWIDMTTASVWGTNISELWAFWGTRAETKYVLYSLNQWTKLCRESKKKMRRRRFWWVGMSPTWYGRCDMGHFCRHWVYPGGVDSILFSSILMMQIWMYMKG